MTPAEVTAELDQLLADSGLPARTAPLLPLGGGIDNRAYAATAGTEVVVKVALGRSRYAVAAWAAARLQRAEVPVPQVLCFNDRLCVETRCPGTPLADLPGAHRDGPIGRVLAVEAGRVLRRVHSIAVERFGRLDSAGVGLHQSAISWLPELPPLPASAPQTLHTVRADVHRALVQHLNLLAVAGPVLLHGDWTARHVITNQAAVTGVVDLESVRGGEPLSDLAGWSLQEGPHLTGWLIDGYFDQPPSPAQCRTLTLHRLRIAACLLAAHADVGDTAGVELRLAQLRADLTDLAQDRPSAVPAITPSSGRHL